MSLWTPAENCGAAKIEAIEKINLVLKETLEQMKSAQTKTGKSTQTKGRNTGREVERTRFMIILVHTHRYQI